MLVCVTRLGVDADLSIIVTVDLRFCIARNHACYVIACSVPLNQNHFREAKSYALQRNYHAVQERRQPKMSVGRTIDLRQDVTSFLGFDVFYVRD